MEPTVRIEGLEEAMRAMRAAFPHDAKKQRSLLNRSLSGAARKAIIPTAKQLALTADESGALSESIAARARSKSKALRRGVAASVTVTPVRGDKKALAMYIQHYYNSRGLSAPAELLSGGIRHGHLIEFGSVKHGASPFLYPALRVGFGGFLREFADSLKKKSQAAVKRAARKKK